MLRRTASGRTIAAPWHVSRSWHSSIRALRHSSCACSLSSRALTSCHSPLASLLHGTNSSSNVIAHAAYGTTYASTQSSRTRSYYPQVILQACAPVCFRLLAARMSDSVSVFSPVFLSVAMSNERRVKVGRYVCNARSKPSTISPHPVRHVVRATVLPLVRLRL